MEKTGIPLRIAWTAANQPPLGRKLLSLSKNLRLIKVINIVPNANTFRRIPYQSGVYEIDLSINLSNHNNDVNFYVSGGGSIFFAFGSNSGNYYASGTTKQFFQSTTPGTPLIYNFVLSSNSYDVYNNSTPIIFNMGKATGMAERIYAQATNGAVGAFELNIFGNKPMFYIDSGTVFTAGQNIITGFRAYNQTSTPFHILSGSFQPLDLVSGANKFPLFVNQLNSSVIQMSGRLTSQNNKSTILTLNTDFGDVDSVITFTGTAFSGSGLVFTTPLAQSVLFGGQALASFVVSNTGTEFVTFQPRVNTILWPIAIGTATYSGSPISNFFSGYLDTDSKFFFSDNIRWNSGEFNIIQENATGLSLINITGESPITGLFLGSDEAFVVGQSINFPFDYHLTGFTMKLGGTGTFASTDVVFARIVQGQGITGATISTSSNIPCTALATGITGSYIDFALPSPAFLQSGNFYSIYLSGDSAWCGNSGASPNRKVILLQNTGNPYPNGSGFKYNGATTFTGDAILSVTNLTPTGARRYLVNQISGYQPKTYTINTGIYNKYMADKNFSFVDATFTSNPNDNQSFTTIYSGAVSGLNIVNITFLGTTYSGFYSGVTN